MVDDKNWLDQISSEVKAKAGNGQAVLLICKDINSAVKMVKQMEGAGFKA